VKVGHCFEEALSGRMQRQRPVHRRTGAFPRVDLTMGRSRPQAGLARRPRTCPAGRICRVGSDFRVSHLAEVAEHPLGVGIQVGKKPECADGLKNGHAAAGHGAAAAGAGLA